MKRLYCILLIGILFFMQSCSPPESTATKQIVPDIPVKDTVTLVDLGAKTCVPCKMMAPILEELKTEYPAVFVVDFIDVWKNTEASKEYGIKVIPTQIFYDREGEELFRHEGFLGREEILAKWREFGILPTEP